MTLWLYVFVDGCCCLAACVFIGWCHTWRLVSVPTCLLSVSCPKEAPPTPTPHMSQHMRHLSRMSRQINTGELTLFTSKEELAFLFKLVRGFADDVMLSSAKFDHFQLQYWDKLCYNTETDVSLPLLPVFKLFTVLLSALYGYLTLDSACIQVAVFTFKNCLYSLVNIVCESSSRGSKSIQWRIKSHFFKQYFDISGLYFLLLLHRCHDVP